MHTLVFYVVVVVRCAAVLSLILPWSFGFEKGEWVESVGSQALRCCVDGDGCCCTAAAAAMTTASGAFFAPFALMCGWWKKQQWYLLGAFVFLLVVVVASWLLPLLA